MSERRFTEEEVAEILKQAAEAENSERGLLPSARGLTLSELNDIGRQAGISPEAIRFAARRIETPQVATRKFLGMPIGVGRTVELDRKLTDSEWEQLVADLRQTFQARGVIKQEGSLRSWRNGNLQASLEPSGTGQRLRLQTVRGGAQQMMTAGLALLGVDVLNAINAAMKGVTGTAGFMSSFEMIALMGVGLLGIGGFTLSRWAKLRQSQMDEIAERVSTNTVGTPMPDV
jgi:hypothetical protein